MSRFIAPDYEKLVPYTPGEQPKDKKYVKLNTNESPFPPSPKVREAVDGAIDTLNLYSDPTLSELTGAIGKAMGVKSENVFCANGSDDVLAFAIMGFSGRGGELVAPDISYSFYPVFADLFGVKLTQIPLKDDFSVDVDAFCGINKNIVIANPNAPTGLWLGIDEIERIVASNPHNLVIIDEAYGDFAPESAIPLTKKYDNLLVTCTFSKSRSLAGLRVGFGVANEEIIKDLNTFRCSFNPYNVNTLSIRAASAAIADKEYYDGCIAEIKAQREAATLRLREMGFAVQNSHSNFVFAKHESKAAKDIYEGLKARGVLVRYFNAPRIDGYVRISIGNKEQMDAFFQALTQVLL